MLTFYLLGGDSSAIDELSNSFLDSLDINEDKSSEDCTSLEDSCDDLSTVEELPVAVAISNNTCKQSVSVTPELDFEEYYDPVANNTTEISSVSPVAISSDESTDLSSLSHNAESVAREESVEVFRNRYNHSDSSAAHTSEGTLDLYETPAEYVELILPYLNRISFDVIYEPCAGHDAIANPLRSHGYNVVSSDISFGTCVDFLTDFEPTVAESIIITNTPFTNKSLFFLRLLELKKPFIALFPTEIINYATILPLLQANKIYLLPIKGNGVFNNKERKVHVGYVSWFFGNMPDGFNDTQFLF